VSILFFLKFSAHCVANCLAARVNGKFASGFVQGVELGIRFKAEDYWHKKTPQPMAAAFSIFLLLRS
jgi:hypothetical protein